MDGYQERLSASTVEDLLPAPEVTRAKHKGELTMKSINLKTACSIATRINEQIKHIKFYRACENEYAVKRERAILDDLNSQLSNDKGYLALDTAIEEAQTRARVRTITAREVVDHLVRISEYLDIPKKHMEGIVITADLNNKKLPSAYKGRPESTVFRAAYRGGWRIESIFRGDTFQRDHGTLISLPDEAKNAIINRYCEF